MPLQAQHLDVTRRTDPGQVFGDFQLTAYQPQRCTYPRLRLFKPFAPGLVQIGFGGHQCRIVLELIRKLQCYAFHFGLQPRHAGQRSPVLGRTLTKVGFGLGRIELGKDLALLDDIPFGDVELRNNTALQRLNNLFARGRDYLAGTGRYLVYFKQIGPYTERQQH